MVRGWAGVVVRKLSEAVARKVVEKAVAKEDNPTVTYSMKFLRNHLKRFYSINV